MNRQRTERNVLFKNRNFIALFIATLLSSPGYYIYLIGVEWLMLTIDDNRFFFGMLFLAASIPRLIFLSFGGVVADRINNRLILFISDVSRAILILVLIGFILTETITSYHLIVLAVFFGISDAFSYPAINSLTPKIVENNQLQRANSLIQLTNQISPIIGPAIGGTLIALFGFIGVFSVATTMLLLSGLSVLFIQLKEIKTEQEKKTIWKSLTEGIHYVRKNEFLLTLVLLALVINLFFTGPISIGLPIMVKDIFKGEVLSLAAVETSIGIGALLGALLLSIFKIKRLGLTLVVNLVLIGLCYSFLGLSRYFYATIVLVSLLGILMQLINIPIITMIQQKADKKLLGRMMSIFMTVSTGLIPVSYMSTSLLIGFGVSIQMIIVTSGIVVILLALTQFRNKTLIKLHYAKEG